MPPRNFIDLTGQDFGRLHVLRRDTTPRNPQNGPAWICECTCGNQASVTTRSLRSHGTKSCGCLIIEAVIATKTRHGANRKGHTTPEYKAWQKMKERCLNPSNRDYPRWGGRGIKICEAWIDSFQQFYADIGPRPSSKHTLERRDNNGPYNRENCRWATRLEQARNTRNNVLLTWNNETHCLSEWSEIVHIHQLTLGERYRAGWSVERILTTPIRTWPSRQARQAP